LAINRGGSLNDRFAAIDQKPLQRARHVPDVLNYPHPLAINRARPLQQRTEPVAPGRDRPLRGLHAERVDRDPGVRLLVGIDPDRHHTVPSLPRMTR
jgi:hypothetical protein